jgi:hypothetical protein
MAEMKGREAVPIEQKCCFLMTSNHLPLWIEPDERRYWTAEINHDGYASGPRSKEFTEIVSRVHEMLTDPEAVARLYNVLVRGELAPVFSAKTLNITNHSTIPRPTLYFTPEVYIGECQYVTCSFRTEAS